MFPVRLCAANSKTSADLHFNKVTICPPKYGPFKWAMPAPPQEPFTPPQAFKILVCKIKAQKTAARAVFMDAPQRQFSLSAP